jgi:hypothetical protein
LKGKLGILNDYFASIFTQEGDGPVPEEEELECGTELGDLNISAEKMHENIKKLCQKDKICPGLL